MINKIFASSIRKYHIDPTTEEGAYQIELAEGEYEANKFDYPSPFTKKSSQVPELLSKPYEDICEGILKELDIYDTHVALITALGLCVLQKGESMDRCRTLPSHYTLTHYLQGNQSDIFYHPAKDLLQIVNPNLDEWIYAESLYINEGDVIIHPSYLEYSTPPVEQERKTITCTIEIAKRPDL